MADKIDTDFELLYNIEEKSIGGIVDLLDCNDNVRLRFYAQIVVIVKDMESLKFIPYSQISSLEAIKQQEKWILRFNVKGGENESVVLDTKAYLELEDVQDILNFLLPKIA